MTSRDSSCLRNLCASVSSWVIVALDNSLLVLFLSSGNQGAVLGSKIIDNDDVSHHSAQKLGEFLSYYADVLETHQTLSFLKQKGWYR